MEYILALLVGYLIGSINFSIIITKFIKKVDIRDVNSHNPGASNATLTLGLKWGILVFVLDVLKGFVPVFIFRMIFPNQDIIWILSGFGSLIGHAFPLYYKFKGGKGTSTYIGVMFGINPLAGLMLLLIGIITTLVSDYIVIGTAFIILGPPIYMLIMGTFHYLSITLIVLFGIINMIKHSNNFVALFKGTETGVREGLKR